MTKVSELLDKSIQNILQNRGISQSDLARTMGIDPSRLSKYLAGKIEPGIEMLRDFSKALQMTPAYLLATHEERIKLDANPAPTLAEKLQAEVASLEPLQLEVLKKAIDALKATQPSGAPRKKAQ